MQLKNIAHLIRVINWLRKKLFAEVNTHIELNLMMIDEHFFDPVTNGQY